MDDKDFLIGIGCRFWDKKRYLRNVYFKIMFCFAFLYNNYDVMMCYTKVLINNYYLQVFFFLSLFCGTCLFFIYMNIRVKDLLMCENIFFLSFFPL